MLYKFISKIGQGGFGVVDKVADAHGKLFARNSPMLDFNLPGWDTLKSKALVIGGILLAKEVFCKCYKGIGNPYASRQESNS